MTISIEDVICLGTRNASTAFGTGATMRPRRHREAREARGPQRISPSISPRRQARLTAPEAQVHNIIYTTFRALPMADIKT